MARDERDKIDKIDEIDYILVGGGLMGSLLATALIQHKQHIRLFDSPHQRSASSVAAGLYNPITGQSMRKASQVDMLFPLLEAHYRGLERLWKTRLLYPMPLYRPFASLSEQARWKQDIRAKTYQPYAAKVSLLPHPSGDVRDSYGGLHVQGAGFVDVPHLLQQAHSFFRTQGIWEGQAWAWERCRLGQEGVEYEGLRARAVISCEGAYVSENPYLKDFPLHPLKGEVLDLATADIPQVIYNREVFMVPFPQGHVRVGATYEHSHNALPSAQGRQALLTKTHSLYRPTTHVLGHQAGLRCCSSDRRPWVGRHPQYPSLYLCNGLGTRGISWAPMLCQAMCAWLLEKKPFGSDIACSEERLAKG